MVPTFTCQMYSHPQKSFVYINLACFYLKQIYYININYILKAFLEVVHLSKQDYERTAQWLTYRPRLTNCSVTYLWTPYYYEKEVKCAVSQIRDGSWVKNPTKLATWPDKINGQLEKISRDPHLLTPRNSLLTLCLYLEHCKVWRITGRIYRSWISAANRRLPQGDTCPNQTGDSHCLKARISWIPAVSTETRPLGLI